MRGEYMASFGELLKELREDKKISQKELAKKIYVTVGTISNYENNQHYPDIEKLIMLADYFNVSTDYLLGRSISPYSPDIFQKQIMPDVSFASIIDDFQKLSQKQRQALLTVLDDMKFRSTVCGL